MEHGWRISCNHGWKTLWITPRIREKSENLCLGSKNGPDEFLVEQRSISRIWIFILRAQKYQQLFEKYKEMPKNSSRKIPNIFWVRFLLMVMVVMMTSRQVLWQLGWWWGYRLPPTHPPATPLSFLASGPMQTSNQLNMVFVQSFFTGIIFANALIRFVLRQECGPSWHANMVLCEILTNSFFRYWMYWTICQTTIHEPLGIQAKMCDKV